VKVVENGDGTFKASYIPDDCGRYVINVSYAGQLLNRNLGSQAHAIGEVSVLIINIFPPLNCLGASVNASNAFFYFSLLIFLFAVVVKSRPRNAQSRREFKTR